MCVFRFISIVYHIIQICSGITRGRVLIGERCAQNLHKLIYLSTDCFMKISLFRSRRLKRVLHETVC